MENGHFQTKRYIVYVFMYIYICLYTCMHNHNIRSDISCVFTMDVSLWCLFWCWPFYLEKKSKYYSFGRKMLALRYFELMNIWMHFKKHRWFQKTNEIQHLFGYPLKLDPFLLNKTGQFAFYRTIFFWSFGKPGFSSWVVYIISGNQVSLPSICIIWIPQYA